MAKSGDEYIVELKPSHLDWGEYRDSSSRDPIAGEGYIPIPIIWAREFDVFNSNNSHTGLGYNLFKASSSDGFLKNVTLLAQGDKSKGDVYAKQFSVRGDLQIIGDWYRHCGAKPGDMVRVKWISSTDILLEFIRT